MIEYCIRITYDWRAFARTTALLIFLSLSCPPASLLFLVQRAKPIKVFFIFFFLSFFALRFSDYIVICVLLCISTPHRFSSCSTRFVFTFFSFIVSYMRAFLRFTSDLIMSFNLFESLIFYPLFNFAVKVVNIFHINNLTRSRETMFFFSKKDHSFAYFCCEQSFVETLRGLLLEVHRMQFLRVI